jgi:hypothetical protein
MQSQEQRLQRFQQAVQSHGFQGQSSPYGGSQSGQGQHGSGSSQWGQSSGGTMTQQRQAVSWSQIQQPGVYVDAVTGDIFRIPPQALANGQCPIIEKETTRIDSRLFLLSNNPFLGPSETYALAQELGQEQAQQ